MLISLLFTTSVIGPASAQAYATDARDEVPNRSRTFKAYERDQGKFFEIFFSTRLPNEKRRIRGRLNLTMPSTAADQLLVATYTVYCAPVGSYSGTNKISGSQNVQRGRSMVLSPRYIFTATTPGDYRCWMKVASGRPRPTATRTTSNVFTVGDGSFLEATGSLHQRSDQGYAPTDRSRVLRKGAGEQAAVLPWTAPTSADQVSVSGDAWLTACTAVEGSKDPVTGQLLCQGLVDRTGSTVNTRIVVGQRNTADNGYCKVTYLPGSGGRESFISRNVHHRMIFAGATVPISNSWGCGRNFRIRIDIRHVKGSPVVVHKQGTISAAIPERGGLLNF